MVWVIFGARKELQNHIFFRDQSIYCIAPENDERNKHKDKVVQEFFRGRELPGINPKTDKYIVSRTRYRPGPVLTEMYVVAGDPNEKGVDKIPFLYSVDVLFSHGMDPKEQIRILSEQGVVKTKEEESTVIGAANATRQYHYIDEASVEKLLNADKLQQQLQQQLRQERISALQKSAQLLATTYAEKPFRDFFASPSDALKAFLNRFQPQLTDFFGRNEAEAVFWKAWNANSEP